MITKKKTKKLVQTLVLATTVVSGTGAFNFSSAHADSLPKVEDIGSGAKIMHSIDTTYHDKKNIKNSIKVSFIDDPNTDKKYAIIFTDGSNIGSNLMKRFNSMYWPSAFKTGLEITSNDGAKFYKVSPQNAIETKKVSSIVSYNIGGSLDVKAEDPSSSVIKPSAGASWSTTVMYEQPDYKTFLENSTDKKVDWKVEFSKFDNRGYGFYTRDSNGFYGNELFMNSRTNPSIDVLDNFISNDELPALTRFGFQPSTMAIVIANKDAVSTDLSVKHAREIDSYSLEYVLFKGWVGNNRKNLEKNLNFRNNDSIDNYKIDWQKNKIIHQ